MEQRVPAVAAALVIFVGCGTSAAPCPNDSVTAGVKNCGAARYFAARDSETLVPSQAEVDRYFDRWSKAIAAEPVLDGRYPQRYRDFNVAPTVTTTNPMVIQAWTAASANMGTGFVRVDLTTGDDSFDAIIRNIDAIGMNTYWSTDGMAYRFTLWVDAVYNEDLLENELAPFMSSIGPAVHRPTDDGTFRWMDSAKPSGEDISTASIEFTFGWGDCMVACDGFHTVRAQVPPGGPATVYDLGGDPLPPGLALSPNTLHPP
jgi:hypothetical protein